MNGDAEARGSRRSAARRAGWPALAICLAMTVTGLALQFRSGQFLFLGLAPASVFVSALMLTCAIIGALLISRAPDHPAGWMWLAIAVMVGVDQLTFGVVAADQLTGPSGSPVVGLALGWQTFNALPFGLVAFTIITLTFPDGQYPSSRWRVVALISIAGALLFTALATYRPGPLLALATVVNPRGVDAAAWRVLGPIMWSALAVSGLALLAGIGSLFVRLRRARGSDRQYIKWLIYAMALFLLGVITQNVGTALGLSSAESLFLAGFAVQILAFTVLMAAIVTAIYRYRLYDIDIIIHRTLVYGLLSAVLGVIYFGSVVSLQSVLRSVSGQESPLAIVVSTLAIAASFAPLRLRVQAFIDRRFYRRKYDAALTQARFAATARDEVDLDALTAELLRVVQETMEPAGLSLWLRAETEARELKVRDER